MTKKFNVTVIPPVPEERYHDSSWPTLGEAEDRRKFLEAYSVGAKVQISVWNQKGDD
uniref:Uncharacterized protein n=1 Tax=viral metagenome TaxID=1070528 RepID=A0A6M3X5A1_9ZZZZ